MTWLNYGLLAFVAALAVALYMVRYETEATAERIAATRAAQETAHAQIRVLKAEWSLVNQPDRLERLSEKFLDLAPLSAPQLVSLDALPPAGTGSLFDPARSRPWHMTSLGGVPPKAAGHAGPIVRMKIAGRDEGVEEIWRR
ncbi:MAG: hypothetical protein HXY25_11340 [Alphaproteobacteria bacterium]|nr:hypothetical protein [Alphaproteobacteria bacterium]